MSKTSMKERNKAVRKAWEREQQLVQEGRGTRNWTEEQQKDILNPDKGKAYDDLGRTFEGQHMKSAAEYPDYQGNPDNIQFLTKDEHLAAHKGSWQNPTNWYYDPVTKEFTEFGDTELIPCKVIQLSDPVAVIQIKDNEPKVQEKEPEVVRNKGEPKKTDGPPPKKIDVEPKQINTPTPPKVDGKFMKGLKAVGKFIVNHPVETLEIAGTVIVGAVEIVSSISGSRKNNGTQNSTSSSSVEKTDIVANVADIVDKANRATPTENDVSGHRQRYHTKDGVVWRDKAPYHRGGKE